MNGSNGPISVVIPCYCCSDTLVRSVSSVQRQSLSPAEIILIDDASPDQGETRKCMERILAGWSADSVIKLVLLFLDTNVGPGGARNAGLDVASGEYIAFLDADDSWAPEKLEFQYEWMRSHPEFMLTAHNSKHIKNSELAVKRGKISYREIDLTSLLLKNRIPTRSVMIVNKQDFRFLPSMRYAEDYWLWLQMSAREIRMATLDVTLAYCYKDEYNVSGLSGNLYEMHKGVLACYADLHCKKIISRSVFLAFCIFEKIKYVKRIIIVKFRSVKKFINISI